VCGRSASGNYTIVQCGTIEKDIVTEQNSLYGQTAREKKIKRKENKG
jgi:hypothetical protein